ncbi:MAG: tyrosine decarboxylase MfnA [Methanotrichaceae archaeon]|nr:tyrosine decarboxylase MfnA [Methanotrichaceae archaeon]
MKEEGISTEEVRRILAGMREKDYRYDRFLSTMCTVPHPIAVEAHDLFMETNLGDPGLFPGASEIERLVIEMMGEMLGSPNAVGYVSTGGTESNIQAIHAARNAFRRKSPKGGNIVVPQSAHFSFDKIGDLLNLEVRKARMDADLKVDLDHVEDLVDRETVALVGIAGTTEFGQVDPILELSEMALDRGIYLHVDAAFGGFVLPFLGSRNRWNFEVEGVKSITIDPHKMGMSTIPAGGLLFREAEFLNLLATDTHYLTVAKQASLTGTRSGASAAATYAVMMRLGRSGFVDIVNRCMDLTRHLVTQARKMGIEPVIEPVMNVVCLNVDDLPGVRSRLMARGWHVSVSREPQALRIIIMPHITRPNLDLFLEDLSTATGAATSAR